MEKADTARSMGNHMDTVIGNLPSVSIDASKYFIFFAIGLLLKISKCSTAVAQDLHI